jgi:hypothetical protein
MAEQMAEYKRAGQRNEGEMTHDRVPAMPKEFNLSDIREICEIIRGKARGLILTRNRQTGEPGERP